MEENRIAIIGIIVEDREAAEQINRLLHQCGEYIVGRMGLPYAKRQGVSTKTVYSKV